MADLIRLSEHPSNLDESAAIVGSVKPGPVVFKVRDGFLPAMDGFTLPGLFRTEAEARAALTGMADMSRPTPTTE